MKYLWYVGSIEQGCDEFMGILFRVSASTMLRPLNLPSRYPRPPQSEDRHGDICRSKRKALAIGRRLGCFHDGGPCIWRHKRLWLRFVGVATSVCFNFAKDVPMK